MDARHKALSGFRRPFITVVALAQRQIDLDRGEIIVGDLAQQMADAIEAGGFFVDHTEQQFGGAYALIVRDLFYRSKWGIVDILGNGHVGVAYKTDVFIDG